MHKKLRFSLILVLLLSLVTVLVLPAAAAEEAEAEPLDPPATVLHIRSLKDFEHFAKKCVRDRYSQNMTVELDCNLDLTDTEFSGIPIFSGILKGNNHTIRGVELTPDGSNQGLIRYLVKGAEVHDLTVKGKILPEGSQNFIGGLVGSNAGTLRNCRFDGEAAGCDAVGGLVGINQVTGIIENCQATGLVRGSHFVGGIAGKNQGIIRFCKNFSHINPEEEDNTIHTVNLTPDFIMGKETAETVTDLGGIAGNSTGLIRECSNMGNVGYPHMGYNIGGIAGSQRGYITQCTNQGNISGRKEVAGIAGQMEPVAQITYTPDTLQILRGQLETTSSLANRASADIRGGAQDIGADISALHEEAGVALDAVGELLSSEGDMDSIIAANNALSGSIGSMQYIASSLNGSVQATVSTAAADIHAITKQITAMSHTLDNAAENLGGTVTDVSDQDTPEDYTAKVSDCENRGSLLGDLNVGGIAGAIAWENDKDPEGDFEISGEQSLNFDSELRAVILDCRNYASVTARKCCGGGIAGNMTLGLVKDCENTGFLDCENADYLGGIVGMGNGFIRSCSSKTKIIGNRYIGGIAGQAPIVSDCRSMVQVEEGSEKLGSVLGNPAEYHEATENPIHGNYYLPLADHLGAIDGIDYYEIADSMSKQDFLALEDLPEIFTRATMTFRYPDGSEQQLSVSLGELVPESKIPDLPEQEGQIAKWDHLEEIDLNNVFLDGTLEVEFTPCNTVLESNLTRESGQPILLAEGLFDHAETFALEPADSAPEKASEAWQLPGFHSRGPVQLHLSVPEDLKPEDAAILVRRADGAWEEIPSRKDGSYRIFPVSDTDTAIAVQQSDAVQQKIIIGSAVGAALLILITVLTVLHVKKKKRRSSKA